MSKQKKFVDIRQDTLIPGTPRQIFELWLDSTKHAALTGGEAHIVPKVGGKFTVFDGWATGATVELVPDRKIVQTWRADDWPPGQESTVTLTLRPAKGGTNLSFQQTGVPAAKAKAIAQGWRDYYWTPLRELLMAASTSQK
ncbi:MAG: SRPBCC family protein [Patescibacteria group bacterium]